MKELKIKPVYWVVFTAGLMCMWAEWNRSRLSGLTWVGAPLLMGVRYLLAIITLFTGIWHFRKSRAISSFLPLYAALVFTALVWGHRIVMGLPDALPDSYVAWNPELGGGDGGTTLFFKQQHLVKLLQQDAPWYVEVWGTYEQQEDTLILDINAPVSFGKTAVIRGDNLTFIDSGTAFSLSR